MADVYDFGAVGDGQQDDSDALQHALDDGDGVLELRKGTYRITRSLVMNLARQGYGAVRGLGGTSRIVMNGPGPAVRILGNHQGTATPASFQPPVWELERFPTISGVEILGKHPDAVGIELFRTMQCTISSVVIRNCRYGVHLVERNRNFLLSHSHIFDNSEYGVFFDHCNLHQTIISANHISYNKKAGIKSLDGDVHNLHITGNDIEYNNHPGVDVSPNGEPCAAEIWFEATSGTISEVTIASNTIQATVTPGGANIRIHGEATGAPRTSPLISITGNVIGSQTRGIELRHVQRMSICGNTIYDSDDLSILVQHSSGISIGSNSIVWRAQEQLPPRDGIRIEDSDNVSLHGLVTQRLCAGSEESGGAFTLERCREASICDCQILDPLHRGIDVIDSRNCRIVNNSVIDRKTTPTMREAIRVRGQSSGILVSGNLTGGATQTEIATGPAGVFVSGNVPASLVSQ